MKRCCTPSVGAGAEGPATAATHRATEAWPARSGAPVPGQQSSGQQSSGQQVPDSPAPGLATLINIAAGVYRVGSDRAEGFPADHEGPAREVVVDAFRIAATPVTNAAFREFVRATGYITEAEQAGAAFVFYLQVDAERRRSLRPVSRELPWWLSVDGACWQRPAGPGSSMVDRLDHPVVQISWHDAMAYCDWSGTRLPTEVEWEVAARGGLVDARYPWGDELMPDGQARCNIWQGEFPARPAPGWQPGTTPVDRFAPNGYGLHDMAGNAWEWCADAFSPEDGAAAAAGRSVDARRVQRGGSFLCHESYCNRYRVAARGSNTPGSSSSNCGFRVAATGQSG